jgi:hypothetical protein
LDDGTKEETLLALIARYGIEFGGMDLADWEAEDRIERTLALVPLVLRDCIQDKATFDHDDEVWWTVKLGLPVRTFDVLLIDEAQDTNIMQQRLAEMACPKGRIVVVGDRFQSIYGFRGADISAIPNLETMLQARPTGCRSFPLTVTRRCPKSHVRLAQHLVPDIRWCEYKHDGIEAPDGEVHEIGMTAAVEKMQPGDLVLCRVNKELVPIGYELLRRGTKAFILGRETGKGLIALVNRLRPTSIPDLMTKLDQWHKREAAKVVGSEENQGQRLQMIEDQVGCIHAACEGVNSVEELKRQLERLFGDIDDGGLPKDAVILGTIHRTKGLEATSVFVVAPHLLPHPLAKQAWELQQECNLAYVAATRAKFTIKDGRVVEPGRLYFIGERPPIFSGPGT